MEKETLDKIVLADIASWLGHQPDEQEQKIVFDYVGDEIQTAYDQKKHVDLSDLATYICDAVKDNFTQCEECGERFLADEMHELGYKCLRCQPNYDPDGMPGGWDDLKIDRAEQ